MKKPHTVTVIEPTPGTDSRGDETSGYGSGLTVGAFLQQTSRTETLGDRDERVSSWVLFSDETPTMTAAARVVWNGKTFQVDGEPNHWTPDGYHHTEAQLSLVEG